MDFSDAELLAYLDEGLPPERMALIEAELRASSLLRQRLAGVAQQREHEGHSLGEIWRRARLSCPSRHQLGSFLLGALPAAQSDYIDFHINTVGCRYCLANLEDLNSSGGPAEEQTRRRQRFFQSSAGYVGRKRLP
jgi:hypothetical protein